MFSCEVSENEAWLSNSSPPNTWNQFLWPARQKSSDTICAEGEPRGSLGGSLQRVRCINAAYRTAAYMHIDDVAPVLACISVYRAHAEADGTVQTQETLDAGRHIVNTRACTFTAP